MKKLDEKGMTLVELIISIGIASLIVLGIVGFSTASSKSYVATKNDFNLQTEAQTTMNYMSDILVEAKEVSIKDRTVTSTGESCKTIVARTMSEGKESVHMFSLVKSKKKIFYVVKEVTAGFTGSESEINSAVAVIDNPINLLSEYAIGMGLNTEKMEKSGKVRLDITFNIRNKKFHVKNDIILRNKMIDAPEVAADRTFNKLNDIFRYSTSAYAHIDNTFPGYYVIVAKSVEYRMVKDALGNKVNKNMDVNNIIIFDINANKLYTTKRVLEVGTPFTNVELTNAFNQLKNDPNKDENFLLCDHLSEFTPAIDIANNKVVVKLKYTSSTPAYEEERTIILQKIKH